MDTLRILSSAFLRKSRSFASMPVALAGGLLLALFSAPVAAQLYGYCVPTCPPFGNHSGVDGTPFSFGFATSPYDGPGFGHGSPASGDLFIDMLVPNQGLSSIPPTSPSIMITGTLSGTAPLFNTSPWTSGNLDSYLKISASPTNSIGAFLPGSLPYAPSSTGFFVWQADLGTTTLTKFVNVFQLPQESLNTELPFGSYIVAFLNEGTATKPNFVATANSGAILVPEPASLLLLATGLLGLGFSRRRRETAG